MNISDIKSSFDRLAQLTESLHSSLSFNEPHLWTPNHGANTNDSLQLIKAALANYWYQDGQEGRETKTYYGFIGVNQEQLDLVKQINMAKDDFKSISTAFSKSHAAEWLELKSQLGGDYKSLHQLMGLSGLGRLHLKQTWRTIPCFDNQPYRIGFNWYTSGKSLTKISIEDCFKMLNDMDQDAKHIQVQLDALGRLPGNYPLVRVQEQSPVMRVNVFHEISGKKLKTARNASLPIFYLKEASDLPSHNEPSLEPPEVRVRAVRKDSKVDPTPLFPSIRVHKYIAQ